MDSFASVGVIQKTTFFSLVFVDFLQMDDEDVEVMALIPKRRCVDVEVLQGVRGPGKITCADLGYGGVGRNNDGPGDSLVDTDEELKGLGCRPRWHRRVDPEGVAHQADVVIVSSATDKGRFDPGNGGGDWRR